MRDLHNSIKPVQVIAAQVASATVTGAEVDLKGYDSVEFLLDVGTEAGSTLCATVRWDFILEAAPDNGSGAPGSWAAVTNADDVLGTMADATTGCLYKVDAVGDAPAIQKFGYVGASQASARFLRVVATKVLSPSNLPCGVTAVLGHPASTPTS